MMTPKEELQQIYRLDKRIKSLKDTITEQQTTLERISPILSDMPRAGGNKNKIEDGVVRGLEYKEKLNKMLWDSWKLKDKITDKIELLDNEIYKTILRERYINLRSFEKISIIFPYSYNHILKLHGHALQAYGRIKDDQLKTKVDRTG